jgi:hypothetical protein
VSHSDNDDAHESGSHHDGGSHHADDSGSDVTTSPARSAEQAEVQRSVDAGTLPHPGEARLPSSPLSTDPLSPGALPLPRWVGFVAAACAILLIPWIVYLAIELPEQTRTAHYDVVWVGFDIGMFAALFGLGLCALRRSTYTEVVAAVTGTLLVTDAWFDVVTADDYAHRVEAMASALLIELPLAALCLWVAQNAERLRRRAYRQLWRLARVEGLLDRRSDAGRGDTEPAP